MKSRVLLELHDVRKVYGQKVVLDDIDLRVRSGEFCTLVGPSGCGKSTLLRLILGEEPPTCGTLTMNGDPLGLPDASRGIVYQRYGLYPHLKVIENLLLGFEMTHSWSRRRELAATWRKRGEEMLAKVRLDGHGEKYPHELSGGMQQRVAIAQSLLMKPPLLLMDEPFGALDADTREEMQVLLLELWEKEKMTLLFITHDLEEALYLGTRALVLSQYYSDKRGTHPGRGSRIVCDHRLPEIATATSVKHNPEFVALIQQMRQEGFDPAHLQHVSDFNLSHPDSFQTLDGEVA